MTERAVGKCAHIITYHNSYSYGACLQAHASQVVLEKLGFGVRFVDYHNPYEDDSLGKSMWGLLAKGNVKGAASTGLRNVLGYRRYALKAFGTFHKAVPKTSVCSRSLDDFQDLASDLLVVGSDQMWNASISGGLDSAFMLDFGQAERRISLATSMGNYVFTDDDTELARRCLSHFTAISVRERHAKEQVDTVTGGNAFICLDPTLLLSARDWRSFARKPKGIGDERYLLVFTVDNRPERAWKVWDHHARKLGVPVYRMANSRVPVSRVDKTFRGMTPQEFVWLIDHAAHVVTDSFHGTAFSLNLETPFTVIPNKQGNNVRMTELLELVGLPERFDDLGGAECPSSVDFTEATMRLADKRSECTSWLADAVNVERS